jgi:hypothetical protein
MDGPARQHNRRRAGLRHDVRERDERELRFTSRRGAGSVRAVYGAGKRCFIGRREHNVGVDDREYRRDDRWQHRRRDDRFYDVGINDGFHDEWHDGGFDRRRHDGEHNDFDHFRHDYEWDNRRNNWIDDWQHHWKHDRKYDWKHNWCNHERESIDRLQWIRAGFDRRPHDARYANVHKHGNFRTNAFIYVWQRDVSRFRRH